MIDRDMELTHREIRIVRRLSRLFRIERSGRLGRRPLDTVRRLIDRRGLLIEELMRLDARRRASALGASGELDLAMGAFATEIEEGGRRCQEVLAELGAELSRLRGEGAATGLRDGVAGQLLGRG
jgi:hypothetical protein